MKHFIGYQSALEYWRRCRSLPGSSANRRCKGALPKKPSKYDPQEFSGQFPQEYSGQFSGFTTPVHIVIGDRSARRGSKLVKQHLFSGETPIGCFMNIGNGLMMSSPEFCFFQMTGQLPLAKLIELGYELCGVYSIPREDDSSIPENGFYNRKPLTSVNKLKAFLETMPGVKGYNIAKRALRYMLDGSASPMETKLAIFLTLPFMLGGYGFKMPELNKRIVLSKTARRYFNKDYYVCDMFWPDERVAVEYDSDQQHTGSERIANDSKRRNALSSLGIRVVSVTKQQLYSSAELESAARTIAKKMNRRLFSRKSKFDAAHRELREQLLP